MYRCDDFSGEFDGTDYESALTSVSVNTRPARPSSSRDGL